MSCLLYSRFCVGVMAILLCSIQKGDAYGDSQLDHAALLVKDGERSHRFSRPVHCPIKNLTQRFIHFIGGQESWPQLLLRGLAGHSTLDNKRFSTTTVDSERGDRAWDRRQQTSLDGECRWRDSEPLALLVSHAPALVLASCLSVYFLVPALQQNWF